MSHVYQPLLPAASRYLQERWDQAAYRQHRSKVDSASPVVDTWGPQPPLHLPVNLKRMQLDRARRAVRERDDCIHSARLLAIAQSRGRVDNWNSYCAHSLSSERRRQELVQIAAENQRLTGRLGRWQVACAQAPWERRWERMEITRDSSARYPCGGQAPQAGMPGRSQHKLGRTRPAGLAASQDTHTRRGRIHRDRRQETEAGSSEPQAPLFGTRGASGRLPAGGELRTPEEGERSGYATPGGSR